MASSEVDIPNVGTINLPDNMQIKDLIAEAGEALREKVSREFNIDLNNEGGIKRNLVAIQKGMKNYARIIVETIPGEPGDFERIDAKYTLSKQEMIEIEESVRSTFASQFKNTPLKILEWYSFKLIYVNGMRALSFSFKRQLLNNPPVIAKYYIFQNYDRMIRLTVSFRLKERHLWEKELENAVHSFKISNNRGNSAVQTVNQNEYTKISQDTEQNQTSEDIFSMLYGKNWLAVLIVSFIITWSVGLTPPLLIRYAFIRKPISKKAAIPIVISFCILNIFLFTAIGSQSKSHFALFLAAVISYHILRKNGKHEPKAKSSNSSLSTQNKKKPDKAPENKEIPKLPPPLPSKNILKKKEPNDFSI
jgi:hypothetical protein